MSTDNHLSTVQLPRRYQRTGDFTEQDGRVPEPDGTSIEPARAVWWNGAEGPVSGQFPQRGSHSPAPGALSDSSGIQGSDRVYSWEQGSTSPPPSYTSLIVWHWHHTALARLAPLSSPTPRWPRVFFRLGVKGRRRIRCV
ncbi:unnamed protein product [Gadus morhua 'NCC']